MIRGEPLERLTLTDQVYQKLRRAIVLREIPPGTRLNEKEVAISLGASVTPVREALNRLKAAGLVEYRPYHGTVVRELTPAEIAALYDVRSALECLAVRQAAPRLTRQDLEFLRGVLARARQALAAGETHLELWHQLNEQFHGFLVAKSGNPFLQQILAGLNDLLFMVRVPLTRVKRGHEATEEHARIISALEAGDATAAEQAMGQHIARVKNEVIAFQAGEVQP